MASVVKTTRVAGFELTLQNKDNADDMPKRTISIDVPSTVDISQVATVASTYFAVAGMSNVFQPTGWRDEKGEFETYILKGVTPILTEKTVTTGDIIVPPSIQKKIQ